MFTKSLILVFLGGGVGSSLRFAISQFYKNQNYLHELIPNVLGCFLIGLALNSMFADNSTFKVFFIVGVLGGFTTFSSYVAFIGQSGFYTPAVLTYFLANNILGLLFYIIGSKVSEFLLN